MRGKWCCLQYGTMEGGLERRNWCLDNDFWGLQGEVVDAFELGPWAPWDSILDGISQLWCKHIEEIWESELHWLHEIRKNRKNWKKNRKKSDSSRSECWAEPRLPFYHQLIQSPLSYAMQQHRLNSECLASIDSIFWRKPKTMTENCRNMSIQDELERTKVMAGSM